MNMTLIQTDLFTNECVLRVKCEGNSGLPWWRLCVRFHVRMERGPVYFTFCGCESDLAKLSKHLAKEYDIS